MNDKAQTPSDASFENPILELSTELPDKRHITIDGAPYFIRHREELGISHLATLDGIVKEYGSIMSRASTGKEITDQEGDLLERPMRQLVDIFLEAPAELTAKLLPQQLVQLMFAFTTALGSKPAGAPTLPRQPANRKGRRTQASSSRGSSASTTRQTR